MKKIILLFCLACFANYGFSQEGLDDEMFDDLFGQQEDIACEDLPEAFKKYDEDRNLNQTAMEKSLSQTIKTLRAISQQELPNSEKNLLELADKMEEAVSLSQANNFIFLDKADNISYFLKDCVSEDIKTAGESDSNNE